MPDFNKMVADMMADLRAENLRLVSALRQKEEEIRRSEEARIRLGADLNDLRVKVHALAADCNRPKVSGLSPVLDMLWGLSIADFTPAKKPPVAKSPKDLVPGWIYTDTMGDPMYISHPRTYRWLTCPETDFYDLYIDPPVNGWPLTPICFVGCRMAYAEARGAYERAR